MPNFKPKANKKIRMNKNSTITLDSKHKEKMSEFEKINTEINTKSFGEKKTTKKKFKTNKY